MPPRSPALHALWRRMLTRRRRRRRRRAQRRVRCAARRGALPLGPVEKEMVGRPREGAERSRRSVLTLARAEIALGNREKGCRSPRLGVAKTGRAGRRGARCSAGRLLRGRERRSGRRRARRGVARDEGLQATANVAVLDAVAAGHKPRSTAPSRSASRLPFPGAAGAAVKSADRRPGGAGVAGDAGAWRERTPGGEARGRRRGRARQRADAGSHSRISIAAAAAGARGGHPAAQCRRIGKHRRALYFKAAEAERTPVQKVRLMQGHPGRRHASRHATADAGRAGAAERPTIAPVPETGWFAETAIEICAALPAQYRPGSPLGGGRAELRRLGGRSGGDGRPLDHGWRWPTSPTPLAAARTRGQSRRWKTSACMAASIRTVEPVGDRARRPRLQRAVRLWEAASRTPQPTTGHLPATGVLAQLQSARRRRSSGGPCCSPWTRSAPMARKARI